MRRRLPQIPSAADRAAFRSEIRVNTAPPLMDSCSRFAVRSTAFRRLHPARRASHRDAATEVCDRGDDGEGPS